MLSVAESIPDEFLTEIGRVVVAFTRIEVEIVCLLRDLVGTDDTTADTVAGRASFGANVDLARLLAAHRMGRIENVSPLVVLERLLVKALHLEKKRNFIAHAKWYRFRTRIDPKTKAETVLTIDPVKYLRNSGGIRAPTGGAWSALALRQVAENCDELVIALRVYRGEVLGRALKPRRPVPRTAAEAEAQGPLPTLDGEAAQVAEIRRAVVAAAKGSQKKDLRRPG